MPFSLDEYSGTMQCPKEVKFANIGLSRPFKIVDYSKEKRYGIVATDLKSLIRKACLKFNIPLELPVRVVLEEDGTEVEDEDYFSTLEEHTALMVLTSQQKWLPPGKYPHYTLIIDEPDGERVSEKRLHKLLDILGDDLTAVTLLGDKELEILAGMEAKNIAEICPNIKPELIDLIKQASVRYLTEKRDVKDALDLLKMYNRRRSVTKDGTENLI